MLSTSRKHIEYMEKKPRSNFDKNDRIGPVIGKKIFFNITFGNPSNIFFYFYFFLSRQSGSATHKTICQHFNIIRRAQSVCKNET